MQEIEAALSFRVATFLPRKEFFPCYPTICARLAVSMDILPSISGIYYGLFIGSVGCHPVDVKRGFSPLHKSGDGLAGIPVVGFLLTLRVIVPPSLPYLKPLQELPSLGGCCKSFKF